MSIIIHTATVTGVLQSEWAGVGSSADGLSPRPKFYASVRLRVRPFALRRETNSCLREEIKVLEFRNSNSAPAMRGLWRRGKCRERAPQQSVLALAIVDA